MVEPLNVGRLGLIYISGVIYIQETVSGIGVLLYSCSDLTDSLIHGTGLETAH